MSSPVSQFPGAGDEEAGVRQGEFQAAPVSHFWLDRLVEIDSTWNPRSWSKRLFLKELEEPCATVRGLFAGEDLIGYLIAHVVLDEAFIVSLGLLPEWRGRGGGSFLLGDFIRHVGLQGVRSVTLDVRVSNIPARVLYEQTGFRAVGVRRSYYSDNQEDAITMRLDLGLSPAQGDSGDALARVRHDTGGRGDV